MPNKEGKATGKVIAVASGKGGTGKTTTVAAISSCLAALGHRTLCIDFDSGLRNLDLSLCMADFAIADYTDILCGRSSLMEACHEHPLIPNLFFLSAPAAFTPHESAGESLSRMFDEIRDVFDYCFVDSPSGIGEGFRLANACADICILVTNSELPAMRDAQLAAEVARGMGVSELRILVNRVIPGNFRQRYTTVDFIINMVGAQLLGLIREDEGVSMSLHQSTPLVLYNRRMAAYDFLDAARRLAGEYIPLRFRRLSKS